MLRRRWCYALCGSEAQSIDAQSVGTVDAWSKKRDGPKSAAVVHCTVSAYRHGQMVAVPLLLLEKVLALGESSCLGGLAAAGVCHPEAERGFGSLGLAL